MAKAQQAQLIKWHMVAKPTVICVNNPVLVQKQDMEEKF